MKNNIAYKNVNRNNKNINKRSSYFYFKKSSLWKYIFIISLSILILKILIKNKLLFLSSKKLLNGDKNYKSSDILNKSNIYNIKKENKFFFFEKNQDELNYCNNYGILIYDYFDGKEEYVEGNIGDYIQSLAALQYLPKNCKPYFIDRDAVRYYYGPKVKLIMNSWNHIIRSNTYISNHISPLFVSYHIDNDNKLPSMYVQNLKKYSPIGCRDNKTRDQLNNYGIKAFFSSCLTTTLDIDYAVDQSQRTNEIIFVDYELGKNTKEEKFFISLKSYNFSNITHIHHEYILESKTHIERFKLAKSLLVRYSKAKLVVSTRIHAALPCLALNTPVIFVNKKYDKRYPGLYELLNTIGINKENKFDIRVNVDNNGLVYNSKDYLKYANKLKDLLKNF